VNRKRTLQALLAISVLSAFTGGAHAATVQVTEWMYRGTGDQPHEFVELTNMSGSVIDMTGWSFDDNSRAPGSFSLSDFGILASGESVILTEMSASDFRTAWGLSSDVKVIGNNSVNLGRADEINIFDASDVLADRLTYGDQDGLGPRTDAKSGTPQDASAIGVNNANLWVLAAVGDADGSWSNTFGEVGNPGTSRFAPPPVPLPATAWLLISALGFMGRAAKRRARTT
jgi:predicted extracellular nuclease